MFASTSIFALSAVKLPSEKTVRVDEAAVGACAREAGVPAAHLMAIVMTESDGIAGYVTDGGIEPAVRFEGHIFYRQLVGAQREDAVARKLASPVAQKIKNPKSQGGRRLMIERAAAINHAAALESVSWGVGQVMAMHWKSMGFRDVFEFVSMAKAGQAGQIALMVQYIKMAGLLDELKKGEWKPLARGYNGPGYAKNKYDAKLERYARLNGGAADVVQPGFLRMGSKGARVREVQAFLVRAGFSVKVDGDFGVSTRDALRQFQKNEKLTVDGVVGPETEKRLSLFRASGEDQPGKQKLLDIPLVRAGGLATIAGSITPGAVDAAKTALESASAQIVGAGVKSVALDYLVSGLTVGAAMLGVAGVAVGIYGWMRSDKTKEA